VLWNHESCNVQHTFPNSIDLESISWNRDGNRFVSSHADGSQSIWSVGNEAITTEETSTPFGPFPCKAITKVEWHDNNILFAGGMPRASYGDKNTVSLMQGSTTQVVFDFSSRVVEFLVISDPENNSKSIVI
jgi:lethal(2) giant larvae protein